MKREPVKMAAAALLPGVVIAMGGRDWVVPPLTLGQLRRLGPTIGQITADAASMLDAQAIDAVVAVVAAALGRNYPDMTEAEIAEMLDLGNAGAVLNAVLTGSGLRRAGPGEAPAPASAGASDGTTSTASSPPPSATGPATPTS
jgi:hypothetical protein